MDLQEGLDALSERIKQLKAQIRTEEATKQSFILPFFQCLGYDVFNPLEFIPEFTADVGIKKHEKVDYAIIMNQEPLILIEAKCCHEKLEKHDSQLFRYFGATKAKFAILTNGIIYRFYTDLEKPNVMDTKPFYELDMTDISEQSLQYLDKFTKTNLDIDCILSAASDLKYISITKNIFKSLLEEPDDEFIRYFLNNGVYDGMKNQKVVERFRPIIKKGMLQFINEKMSSKFKETLNNSTESQDLDNKEEPVEVNKIFTSIDELNAFAIVKSIVRRVVDAKRVTYRDTESYFGVLLDDNGRKWICRIKLDSKNKHILISDENKNGIRHELTSLDDIYLLENELLASIRKYIE